MNRFAVAVVVAFSSTAAFAQDVKVDFDKDANFANYKSFTLKIGTSWNNEISEKRISSEFKQALVEKGWQIEDPGKADAIVVLHGATDKQKSLNTFYSGGGGYGGYGWRGMGYGGMGMGSSTTTVSEYLVGTLVVDIFDAKTKALLFRGIASDEISDKPEKNKRRSTRRPRRCSRTSRPGRRRSSDASVPRVTTVRALSRAVAFGLALQAATAWGAKTDVVVLKNGDHLTGEVDQLERGRLTFKTDDIGTVEIEWDNVQSVTAAAPFDVDDLSGDRYLGTLAPGPAAGQVLIAWKGEEHTVELRRIVRIRRLYTSFWRRLDGSLDVGASYTSASELFKADLAGNIGIERPGLRGLAGRDLHAHHAAGRGRDPAQPRCRSATSGASRTAGWPWPRSRWSRTASWVSTCAARRRWPAGATSCREDRPGC